MSYFIQKTQLGWGPDRQMRFDLYERRNGKRVFIRTLSVPRPYQ